MRLQARSYFSLLNGGPQERWMQQTDMEKAVIMAEVSMQTTLPDARTTAWREIQLRIVFSRK